jgi:hypothetical protein
MKITIEIPDDQLRDALDSGELRVDLSNRPRVSLTEEEKTRRERSRLKNQRIRNSLVLNPEEQRVLDLWNESFFIKGVRSSEGRNRPVTKKELPEVSTLIRRCLREVGYEEIKRYVDSYFACCSREGHIWGGVNRGFAHLGGLLSKILNYKRSGQKPWWEGAPDDDFVDEFPEFTQRIADQFAREFLHLSSFDLKSSRGDFIKFATLAKLAKGVAALNLLPGDSPEELFVECIFKIVRRNAESMGVAVTPGSLVSGFVRRILLPQYLSDSLGLDSKAIQRICAVIQ